jgi:hypothetical protein
MVGATTIGGIALRMREAIDGPSRGRGDIEMAIGEPLVWISVISGRLSRLKAVAKARGVMTSERGRTGVDGGGEEVFMLR